MSEFVNIINKTKIYSDIKFLNCNNYPYDELYIVKMWKYFAIQKGETEFKTIIDLEEEFKPIDEIYKIVSVFFEAIYESKYDVLALHFIPNYKNQIPIVILKLDKDFRVLTVNADERKIAFNEHYSKKGMFGNFVAIYLTK